MLKFSKSEVKLFYSEKELNDFIRSGAIDEIISIVPKMTHFVIFYLPKEGINLQKNKSSKKGD
jgi:hypothetical protein